MKRYLAAGINEYEGAPLAGCVNDVYDWSDALGDRGFVGTVLTDSEATLANITAEFRDMLATARRGDTLVFQYSGHGTWLPDRSGDEPDRRDEALVPFDYADAGLLTDDALHRLVEDNRADGVKVLIISDSCHSGTVMRAMGANERHGLENAWTSPVSAVYGATPSVLPQARFLPPVHVLPRDLIPLAEEVQVLPVRGTPRTGAALLSACRDDQVAYDAWFGDRANGAFTRAALDALESVHPRSLDAWRDATVDLMRYDQSPQLNGTWWQRHMSRWV